MDDEDTPDGKSNKKPIVFRLSPGNTDDAGEDRRPMESIGPIERTAAVLMYKAYSDVKTRQAAGSMNFRPVVPPKKNRKAPWRFDPEEMCLSPIKFR